jgi:glycosyltransferase involved in cell wall biosynthesis
MILVYEPVCWGLEHVPVNAGILETIRLAYPSEELTFCGEQSHLHQLRAQLSPDIATSISWKPMLLPPRHAQFLERIRSDLKLLSRLFKMLKKEPGLLVLTAAAAATLMALKLLCCTMYRDQRVQIVLHGNVATLNGWRSRNPLRRIQDLRTALGFSGNRNLQYLLLEEPIRRAVAQHCPPLEKHFALLEHPIPANEEPKGIIEFGPPFRIGFIGLTTEEKGFPLFLQVAAVMSAKFPALVELHAIGWSVEQWDSSEISSLATKPGTSRLSRSEFISQIEKLHFVCLPYQGPHYELSASGALLDAIAWEKPLICSRIPIIENLVSRFGDIGYFCADKREFCETIEGIILRADINKYRKQVSSLRAVRRSRTPQYLASTYRDLRWKLFSKDRKPARASCQ